MRSPRWVWALALGLLLVRALLLAASVSPDRALTGDENQYDGPARSVLQGHGFTHLGQPWVWKPPLWPLVLAGVKGVFGQDHRPAVFVQGLFDAGTALLAWFVTRRLFGSVRAAWIAFALVALWPPYLRESRFLQTEPLYTLGVAATLAAFVRFAQRPTVASSLVMGLVIGGSSLVRPTGFAVAAALFLTWFVLDRGVIRSWRALVPMALAAALVVAPWTLRNARVFHAFIPFSTGGGEVFAMGTSTTTDGRWHERLWLHERDSLWTLEARRVGHALGVVEKDKVLYAVGIERWRQDPATQLHLWGKRLWRTFALPVGQPHLAIRVAFLAVLVALYALAFAGARLAWRRRDALSRLGMVMIVTYAVHGLLLSGVAASSRYTEPARMMLLLLAAGAIASWLPGPRPDAPEPAPR